MARPKSADPLLPLPARVPKSDLDYLALWSSEPGLALRELIGSARRMWPGGPATAGGGPKTHSRPIVTPRLKKLAEQRGMAPKDLGAAIISDYLDALGGGD